MAKPIKNPVCEGQLFELGQVVVTAGVNEFLKEHPEARFYVSTILVRHARGDWGDMCAEDLKANDDALNYPGDELGGRLFSAYVSDRWPKMWIITEWDNSATTVLFPDEY